MAKKRCRWFEDNWTDYGILSKYPKHKTECPYSDRYLVPGTERCIFHLSKEHEEKAKRFEEDLEKVLSNKPVVWSDEDDVKCVDLFGFIFPDEFSLKAVLDRHPPEFPLCLVGADLQGADLRWAQLQGADLCDAHLQGADLGSTDLQGADLRVAHLQGADFSQAHLQGADLRVAHLQGADLSDADLQGADLMWADLQGADLGWTHLQGTDLKWAHLQGAHLRGAHLQGAYLADADLQGADLEDAHLQGACLVGAHLQGAYLCEAHLQGADIHRAHLQGACFVGAYLQGAKLRYTDLQGTDLYDAQLQGADLTRAQLQGADLSHAQLCADPGYRPGEEWDEWIKDSENNEWAKDRLLEGKQRLTGGLDAASLTKADLGAGQCKGKTRIKLTAIDNKYREETYQRIVKNVSSWGIVTLVYNDNNKEIEAVELELAPAVLEETDLRGVDLSKSTIAGADFTSARLDGTLLRGTQFGIKKPNKEGVFEYDSHWHHKDRRGYSDKIKRNRVKLFNKYRRLKPKWLRSLLKPLIKRRVKSTMIRAELPIFEEANLEAADWADNRRAQRDFIYAEYVRQFKHRHPRIAKLWSITCDYGRTLKRWAAWSAAFMILFGFLFLASHLLHKADDNWFTRNVLPQVELQHELQKGQPTEFSYFYFSAVTFTTLGFGDVTPINLAGQIAVTIEVILGYVMLGGLISIFAVKLARRD